MPLPAFSISNINTISNDATIVAGRRLADNAYSVSETSKGGKLIRKVDITLEIGIGKTWKVEIIVRIL